MESWELKMRVEQKQLMIDTGIIRNSRTLQLAKRDIKRWQEKLNPLTNNKYGNNSRKS